MSSGSAVRSGRLLPVDGSELLASVRARREEWVSLVEELARVESPSTEPATQERVFAIVSERLRALGYRTRRMAGRRTGGAILARPSDRDRRPPQLLLGHVDTVWPVGTLESMPIRREGGRLSGPGVFDMKGGVAHIPVALAALAELGLAPPLTPVVFLNADEEIGSPETTRHVRRLASASDRVFVMEPALGTEGRIKTVRKGTGKFTIRVTGVSAHAGLDPERGASAIQELSHVIQALHGLTDASRGIVVNVGEIRGGLRPNVIAAEARAEVDVRINSEAEGRWVEERIRAIEPIVPGCRIVVEGRIDRPPLEPTPANRALWTRALGVAEELGITVEEGRAGGASDGNTASRYAPTLDGLGAVGDGAHAVHEYVDVGPSIDRCALLAGLLLSPPPTRPELSGIGRREGGPL